MGIGAPVTWDDDAVKGMIIWAGRTPVNVDDTLLAHTDRSPGSQLH